MTLFTSHNLDAGQGSGSPVRRPASPGLNPPAAIAPVPGRATAHSLNTSPAAACAPPSGSGPQGEARGAGPSARSATPAHPMPPAGARVAREAHNAPLVRIVLVGEHYRLTGRMPRWAT